MPTQSSPVTSYSAPLGVFLNLTQQCNMRCVYCCAEAVRPGQSPHPELGDEEVLALVEHLAAAKVFRYVLTGGEVFLRRELLFRVLERLQGFSVTLLTNATLVTEKDAGRLAGFKPGLQVAVSIDAPDEESNARTRGRGFLARTLRGARRLQAAGITPSINCVVTRANHRLVPELVEMLKVQGFRKLLIIPLQPVGHARTALSTLVLDREERQAFTRAVVELAAHEEGLEVVAAEDRKWLGLPQAAARLRVQGEEEPGPAMLLGCSAGVEQCNITADGWITPCNAMMAYRCGNVRENDFLTLWRESSELQALRRLRQTPVTAVAECASCEHRIVCRGGCRALGLACSGDLLGFDPTCPYQEVKPKEARRSALLPVLQ